MSLYNLLEYNNNYSKTSGSLFKYYTDEPALDDDGNIVSFDTTNNYLLKLIKKQRHKYAFVYMVRVSLAKSEQVFPCSIKLNSFNGTDLSWALRVGSKSFIQSDCDIFRFHLLFLKFLAMILKISWATWSLCFSMLCLSMCDLWSLPFWSLIRFCMRHAVSPI